MVRLMTEDMQVVEASKAFLPWLLLMPVVGCAAFTWDGIYIGATASKQLRNSMIWAVVAFAGLWALGIGVLNFVASDVPTYRNMAMHILMAAYFAHLLARTVYLSAKFACLPFHAGKAR